MNCILAKCDVHDKTIRIYEENGQLKFDFDGTILTKNKE